MDKRHFNDPPTIREMLDCIEKSNVADTAFLLMMLRLAIESIEQCDLELGLPASARDNLQAIERGLWATTPKELWYEKPEADAGNHAMMNQSRIEQALFLSKQARDNAVASQNYYIAKYWQGYIDGARKVVSEMKTRQI